MIYKNNISPMPKGLELDQVWFSGGRAGLTLFGHGGIGEILYYGTQFQGGHTVRPQQGSDARPHMEPVSPTEHFSTCGQS